MGRLASPGTAARQEAAALRAPHTACFLPFRRRNRPPKSPGPAPAKWGETWEEPRSSTGLKLIHEAAPKALKWTLVLCDESRRSYAAFMPSPAGPNSLKMPAKKARV